MNVVLNFRLLAVTKRAAAEAAMNQRERLVAMCGSNDGFFHIGKEVRTYLNEKNAATSGT